MPFHDGIFTGITDFSKFSFEHFETLARFCLDLNGSICVQYSGNVNKRFLLFNFFSSCQIQEDVGFVSVIPFSISGRDEYFIMIFHNDVMFYPIPHYHQRPVMQRLLSSPIPSKTHDVLPAAPLPNVGDLCYLP